MKAQNLSLFKNNKKLQFLSSSAINKIATQSGFHKRNRGKLTAFILISTFMEILKNRASSYQQWAIYLSNNINGYISKQAVFNRMNDAFLITVKALLKNIVGEHIRHNIKTALFEAFGQVWVQDSTNFHLPEVMYERFKGSVSKGKPKAIAKLNVVSNVLTGACPILEWMSFRDNDQKIASNNLSILKKGDLLIRDLGFFVLSAFEQLNAKGVYFLSKLRYGLNLYDTETKKRINLIKLLKGKNYIDRNFALGNNSRISIRLIAIKLPEKETEKRIRRAKNDRDKRLNHSKEYYSLLGYMIFITNVPENIWNYKQATEAYKVRWNIEILFKSWKSGLKINELIPEARTQLNRVEITLYLIMIYVSCFQLRINTAIEHNKQAQEQAISQYRLYKYIFHLFNLWLISDINNEVINFIKYYCKYDKRADRINAFQLKSGCNNCLA